MTERDLLTVGDRVELLVNGLNSGVDYQPVLKLFTPDGSSAWLMTECDPDDPDRLFGLYDLRLGYPELGYVSLSEIQTVTCRLGIPVERDMHFTADKPLSAFASEAREKGRIIA
jgi:Protein of unknown function (DUF2958)